MSLREVWDASARSPFEPAIGKDSQLFVGLLLISIGTYHCFSCWADCANALQGVIFTVLFGLNRSLVAVPVLGLPASIAFG